MPDDDVQREIGRLQARADSTDERLERIEAKVDQIMEFVSSAKGSWRMLVGIGALSASLTAAVSTIMAKLWPH